MKKIINHLKENWIKYGFETIVITIGILGAFMLNNWNETRKNNLIEIQIYNQLTNSLRTDSVQLARIISDLESSLNVQRQINNMDYDLIISSYDPDSLLEEYNRGVYSFFPKEGVYQLLIKNNQLDLIRSEELKSRLIELYDFRYQKYKNIDGIIDQKFQFSFEHVAFGKMKFSGEGLTKYGFTNNFDVLLFEEHYDDLREVTRNLSSITFGALASLIQIQLEVNLILIELQLQLNPD